LLLRSFNPDVAKNELKNIYISKEKALNNHFEQERKKLEKKYEEATKCLFKEYSNTLELIDKTEAVIEAFTMRQ